jgi:hypothetical protein
MVWFNYLEIIKLCILLVDQKYQKLLGSIGTGYNKGGSVGDAVPALLTPGEFVINKKSAAELGASRLHRLNRADKISGFNSGGEVGSVPRFSSGE